MIAKFAIPLATETANKITNFYDLMDSAYDCSQILEHSRNLGHVPIIDHNVRGNSEKKAAKEKKQKLERHFNGLIQNKFDIIKEPQLKESIVGSKMTLVGECCE